MFGAVLYLAAAPGAVARKSNPELADPAELGAQPGFDGQSSAADLPDLFVPATVKAKARSRAIAPSAGPIPFNAARLGPRPRPFVLETIGAERERALQCLTAAIYYEAAQEPTSGQEAVAQVVLNRMRHPRYPKSVCAVVFQGSERRTGCQFSFTCDGAMYRRPSMAGWARARGVAVRALDGHVSAEAASATHYHTSWVRPYWSGGLVRLGQIGAHIFYRSPGAAGPGAGVYAGGELGVTRAAAIGQPWAAPAASRAAGGAPDASPVRAPKDAAFTVWGLSIPAAAPPAAG